MPLSALVLVRELAGNYDLLVPLMLSEGIVFLALRRRSLYEAQVPTVHDSPVHRDAALADALHGTSVGVGLSERWSAARCPARRGPRARGSVIAMPSAASCRTRLGSRRRCTVCRPCRAARTRAG